MKIDILSPFPEIITAPLSHSIIGKAQEKGLIEIKAHQLRKWGIGKHRQIDDTPYGGGCGMVLKPEPIFQAVEELRKKETKIILTNPQGKLFKQATAKRLSKEKHLIIICGHYEGIDHRVTEYLADEEISIGNYILTNGTLAATIISDAIVRLIPKVLGNSQSIIEESFSQADEIEAPTYTNPEIFQNKAVPPVLLSGNHKKIQEWKKQESEIRKEQRNKENQS